MKLGRGVALMKRGEWGKAEEGLREAGTGLQQAGDGQGTGPIERDIQANLAVAALHLNPASKLENAGQEHLEWVREGTMTMMRSRC